MKKTQTWEVLILVLLGIILAGFLGVKYLIKPIDAKTEAVNQKIASKETELKAAYYTVAAYDSKCATLGTLKKALENYTDKYYTETAEDVYLDNIAAQANYNKVIFDSLQAQVSSFKVADMTRIKEPAPLLYRELSQDQIVKNSSAVKKYEDTFNQFQAKGGRFETDIHNTQITLEVEGKYADIFKFLSSLTGSEKQIVSNSLTLDIPENISLRADSNPAVKLSLSLSYLSIPALASVREIPEPQALSTYAFPQKILDGKYRTKANLFSVIAGFLR